MLDDETYAEFCARTQNWSFLRWHPVTEQFERTAYADLPRWAHSLKSMSRYRNAPHWRDCGFRCFYTGIETCLVSGSEINRLTANRFPLSATVEHLVPERHAAIHGEATRDVGNEFLSSFAANALACHKPLPIKLMGRRNMLRAKLDEEMLSERPFRVLIDCFEADEKALEVHGVRPWNPQAINNPLVAAAARDFMIRMHAAETEFLALPILERLAWIDAFDIEQWVRVGA